MTAFNPNILPDLVEQTVEARTLARLFLEEVIDRKTLKGILTGPRFNMPLNNINPLLSEIKAEMRLENMERRLNDLERKIK